MRLLVNDFCLFNLFYLIHTMSCVFKFMLLMSKNVKGQICCIFTIKLLFVSFNNLLASKFLFNMKYNISKPYSYSYTTMIASIISRNWT